MALRDFSKKGHNGYHWATKDIQNEEEAGSLHDVRFPISLVVVSVSTRTVSQH